MTASFFLNMNVAVDLELVLKTTLQLHPHPTQFVTIITLCFVFKTCAVSQ